MIFKYINRDLLLFFMLGAVVFSPMSTTIIMDILQLPLSLPELLVIPFSFLLRKYLTSIKITGTEFLTSGVVCLFLIVLGLVQGSFSLYAMLSSSRSWFYLFIFYFAFKKSNLITNNHILALSLGSIVSWMIISRLNFYVILRNIVTDQGDMCTYGPMVLVPLFITLSMTMKKYKTLILGICCLLPTCIFSGVRRLMVVTLLSVAMSYILSLKKSKRNFFSYLIIGVFFFLIAAALLPIIMDAVESASPEMYYRIFGRTLSFLESGDSESAGDLSRMAHITGFFNNWYEYIIPRGMISLHTSTDAGVGLFNDFPLYQLCWIFGLPIAFVFICYFLLAVVKNYRLFNINQNDTSAYSICCLCIMFCMLFLDGTFLGFAEYTPLTGALLGIAVRNIRTHKRPLKNAKSSLK